MKLELQGPQETVISEVRVVAKGARNSNKKKKK
jgi:hypothetical protein